MGSRARTWPGLEAQVAAISDDIAYDNHDIDDGLRAGLLDIDELVELPLVRRPVGRDRRRATQAYRSRSDSARLSAT